MNVGQAKRIRKKKVDYNKVISRVHKVEEKGNKFSIR